MGTIFKNNNSQIRSGWKILIVILITLLIVSVFSIALFILLKIVGVKGLYKDGTINNILGSTNNLLFQSISSFLAFALLIIFIWKKFEKKNISEIGLTAINKGYNRFIFGLILGGGSITLIAIVLYYFGDVDLKMSIISGKMVYDLVIGFISFVLVGFYEEIFFRGYCLNVLKQMKNKYFIIIISSFIFAILHTMNPNISILAVLNIFIVGILFALMTLKTGDLWIAIGFHITWNYFQGFIFGFEVSGVETKSFINAKIYNDNFINGGKFGLEGGIATTIILALSIALILYIYRDKKIVI